LSALVALTHCLIVDLDRRLDAGEQLPTMPPWHVQENKWRAARYGLDAIIIRDSDNTEVHVVDDINELLGRLEPTARTLGCTRELAGVTDILDAGAGYQRMRAAAEADGAIDLQAAVREMVVHPTR
jgi:glutamate---cysteine ligase / carboxylate-amine ligase